MSLNLNLTGLGAWELTYFQQIDGIHINDAVIFEGLNNNPLTAVDAQRQLIRLNTIQFVNFVQLTETFRLRFEPLPWIPKITLAIWEYRGTESDTNEDLLNAIRAKLETIEFKINQT